MNSSGVFLDGCQVSNTGVRPYNLKVISALPKMRTITLKVQF